MATTKQKLVLPKIVENHGNLYKAMVAVGYSPATAKNPSNLLKSKGFRELLEEVLPDEELAKVHKSLLGSHRLDHMTFPLGPDSPAKAAEWIEEERVKALQKGREPKITERSILTDEDIEVMLRELGCRVRRVVHGEMARHVYFWAPNDKTRHDALKLAYDLKGKVTQGKEPTGDTYNTFIQQNNINPNAPKAKALVDDTLDMLMKKTSRKVIDL